MTHQRQQEYSCTKLESHTRWERLSVKPVELSALAEAMKQEYLNY